MSKQDTQSSGFAIPPGGSMTFRMSFGDAGKPAAWTVEPCHGLKEGKAEYRAQVWADDSRVCLIECQNCGPEEADRRAALIAAAPDLLEAMRSISLIANGGHGTPSQNLAGIYKLAVAAIAKAAPKD